MSFFDLAIPLALGAVAGTMDVFSGWWAMRRDDVPWLRDIIAAAAGIVVAAAQFELSVFHSRMEGVRASRLPFAKGQSNELGPRSWVRGREMGLFTRKCAWCGARLANPTYVERMGNRFCSEEHAESYLAQQRAAGGAGKSEGCC